MFTRSFYKFSIKSFRFLFDVCLDMYIVASCFLLVLWGSSGIFGSPLSCFLFGTISVASTSCLLWNALFAKYRSCLIKLSNSFLTPNQLSSFGVGIKNGSFARTDSCGVVNTFDGRLIAFWSGPSSLTFLTLFYFFSFLFYLIFSWKSSLLIVNCYCCYF